MKLPILPLLLLLVATAIAVTGLPEPNYFVSFDADVPKIYYNMTKQAAKDMGATVSYEYTVLK
jgi:hypothetical protein